MYKVEPYVRQCLDSLVRQTYPNVEILLIDDGSPDNSAVICGEYAQRYNNITFLRQENAGVSVARNNGLDHATGDYVLFVDPDDWIELDCCERLNEAIQEKQYDIVFFMDRVLDENKGTEIVHDLGDIRIIQYHTIANSYRSYGFHSGTPWGKFMRRSFLEKHHFRFAPGVVKAQDVLMDTQIYERLENAFYLNYSGYVYRLNEGSSNVRFNPKIVKGTYLLVEGLGQVADLHDGDSNYQQSMAQTCVDRINFMERLYLFHPKGNVSKQEALRVYREYLALPTVKKYFRYYDLRRSRNTGERVRYLLLRNGFVRLYDTVVRMRYSGSSGHKA